MQQSRFGLGSVITSALFLGTIIGIVVWMSVSGTRPTAVRPQVR